MKEGELGAFVPFAKIFSIGCSIVAAILWAIIAIAGIRLAGPHGEMGGVVLFAFLFTLAAAPGCLFVIVSLITGLYRRSYPVRAVAATLNVILILCSIAVLFSPRGIVARMFAGNVEVERNFARELKGDPGQHICIDGGKPATRAVVYGRNPGIIRWYCDPNNAPRFITVPSRAVPMSAVSPINLVFYVLMLIAHLVALLFAATFLGHVFPVAVPRFALRSHKYWARQFGLGSAFKGGFGLFLVYVVVFANLCMWFVPAPQ
jgi:hypothetical protein